jgi:hypothetical protein
MMKSTFMETLPSFSGAWPHARRRLKSKNSRVDRGFEAPVDRQIGAIDPARAVRAQKEDRGRDIGAEPARPTPCVIALQNVVIYDNIALNDPYSANFMAQSRATRF